MKFIACLGYREKDWKMSGTQQVAVGKAMQAFLLEQATYDRETKRFRDDEEIFVVTDGADGVNDVWTRVGLKLAQGNGRKFKIDFIAPEMKNDLIFLGDAATDIFVVWDGDETSKLGKAVVKLQERTATLTVFNPNTNQIHVCTKDTQRA